MLKKSFYLETNRKKQVFKAQIMIGALMQSEYEKAMIANVKEDFGLLLLTQLRFQR